MGFFDSAIKNIVKKAKPLLPVAAMFAAPYLAPKMSAFLAAGGKGAGLGSLLGGYGSKFGAMPMMLKAPVTSGLTSYGLARLMGQKNPEKAALYSALASMPFAYMKANAYANALDGKGGISAFDVLKAPGGSDFMIQTGMENPRMTGYGTPPVQNRIGGPGFPHETFKGGFGERFPTYSQTGTPTYKTMPGMEFEDLLRNQTARKGMLGNEIPAGSFDMRAAMPLLAGYGGGEPTSEQMEEIQKEKEKRRMAMMYEMMQNPYYSYVPDSLPFTPYANGGSVEGPYMDPMPSDDMDINVKEIIQGPGYESIEDLDMFQEATASGMHPLVEFREMYDQYIIDGGELSFKEFFDMIQGELGREDLMGVAGEKRYEDYINRGLGEKTAMSEPHPMAGWYDMYDDQINSGEFKGTFDEFMEMINDSDFTPSAATGGIMELNLTTGGAANGPGTGTSDSIPAKLSDGEFVMTAKAVENFGGGDRYEGARKMYNMMNSLDPNSEKPSEAKAIA